MQAGQEAADEPEEHSHAYFDSPVDAWSAVECGRNWGLPPHLDPALHSSQASGAGLYFVCIYV